MDDREKQQLYDRAEELLAEQNFRAAVIAGTFASILAAVAYAIVAIVLPQATIFAAAGVGILVGLAVGFLGRGITSKFGVMAALYTIAGCILGNIFAAALQLAPQRPTSLLEILPDAPVSEVLELGLSFIGLGDMIFWFVGVFAAVFLAKRALSRADKLALGRYELRN